MALKKSELYSSLWQSCDLLRGGMDASQYKDYVLALLFMKYVSDKYAGVPFAPFEVPEGSSFRDMVALKGASDIGDKLNKLLAPLRDANSLEMPDFNDANKLGSGKDMVDRLTSLIAVFEDPKLDFSRNRADGDDILGDAYEYLMRHFATESGKSKGQFYTPAEVSRVMAQIIGIRTAHTSSDTTVYDPTCGSGSLLLKVADAAPTEVTLNGQEKDATTAGLARMNMILHDNSTALIEQGNTLASPRFFEPSGALKTFDFVVANPPFSDKRWSSGLSPGEDHYERFTPYGIPPDKQGDFAYLLHIVRSLKPSGKGACILPHGVLFRGNAEADIRKNLVRRGYIKGIIGLPPNLFFGTGIPACIVVVDKENAQARRGVFIVDASGGYAKDGPKNRLREQDIHRIVDVFTRQADVPGYARMVGLDEIERNDYNLNIPRYIDSRLAEDLQDIEGHLRGGIPERDINALADYWKVCPNLRAALFADLRPGYLCLAVDKSDVQTVIHDHPEYAAYRAGMERHFDQWRAWAAGCLKALEVNFLPKHLIADISENLLAHYKGQPLIHPYAVYQRLMDYWAATMQDDAYQIAADGWKAETYRVMEDKKDKDGKVVKRVDRGWACDLVPKSLIVASCFAADQAKIDALAADLETVRAELAELEEENGGDDGAFIDARTKGADGKEGKVTRPTVKSRLKEIGGLFQTDSDDAAQAAVLNQWLALEGRESELKKTLAQAESALDAAAYAKYPTLTELEIKTLAVDDKWLAALSTDIHGEMRRISQTLTTRVKQLADRYETPLAELSDGVATLDARVSGHLERMGFLL